MNKLYITLTLLLGFTITNAQITQMIIHENSGTTTVFQIANIDSITYDTTTCLPIIDSRDGEVYAVFTVGNQCWMAENLRYNAPGSYLNPANPDPIYGRLYSWITVMDGASWTAANPSGVQGLCPNGWHLPSDSEWNELEVALGMSPADTSTIGVTYRGTHGLGMKSTTGWSTTNGTNTSGFDGYPAGLYFSGYSGLNTGSSFWSTTRDVPSHPNVIVRFLVDTQDGVARLNDGSVHGRSCRCVKD